MRSFVNVECGLLRESFEANVALVGALSRVRAVVNLQVLFTGERGRALQALEGPALDCEQRWRLVGTRESARTHYFLLRVLQANSRDPIGRGGRDVTCLEWS